MNNQCVNRIKISYILNCLIFIFSVFAFIIMFTGYKLTFIKEPILETNKIIAFRFFTVDSNFLMGIVALIFACKEKELLLGKNKEMSFVYYVIKLVSTVSVCITMLVVFIYLGRIADGGLISLLQNSNMFFHLIIPLLSLITFLFFERTNKIKYKHVVFVLLPVLLYGIYYVLNLILHIENGAVSPKYDWYYFAQNGINSAYYAAGGILLFTYVVGLLVWILNKKRIKKTNE